MQQIDRDRLVRTFLELVAIDALARRERPVADYITQKLQSWGVNWQEDGAGEKIGGNCGNLIVSMPGDGEPWLFLCSHMDTVRPTANLKPQVKEGVIASDGTTILGADNRAGVAALLYVLEEAAHHRFAHRNFEVLFTVAEEIGLLGAANLSWDCVQSGMGYIFDSSRPPGQYIEVTPSSVELVIDIYGKPAHAGVAPEKGINALRIATAVLADFPAGRIDAETVANIGIIRGGEATNVVPAHIHLEGEIRSLNPATIDRMLAALASSLKAATQAAGGRYEFRHAPHFQGYTIPRDHFIARHLHEKMRRLGLEPAPQVYHGGSDANVFNATGKPAINLGIGATNPHGNDEHIAIEDLVKVAALGMALVASE